MRSATTPTVAAWKIGAFGFLLTAIRNGLPLTHRAPGDVAVDVGAHLPPSRPPTENRVLRFGIFELDTRTLELRREGRLIHLRLQSVQVLRMLLERSGQLVTRSEITDALWPDDVDVDQEVVDEDASAGPSRRGFE